MLRKAWIHLFACATSALLFPACDGNGIEGSGSSGGGGTTVVLEVEPNDLPAQARTLSIGRFGAGDVATPGDTDFWKVGLAAGNVIQVELLATRLDQAGWDAAANAPRLSLYSLDGVTKLLEHDLVGFGAAGFAAQDLDVPLFRVPATGAYYVAVAQDDAALPGGEYAVRVTRLPPATLQQEAEAALATGVNDTPTFAQAIQPGTLHGFHVAGESDFYSFTITSPAHVRFESTAWRNGVFGAELEYVDPVLTLYDEDGTTELASIDDAFFADPAIHHRLIDAGTYFLEVTDCCDGGAGAYFLRFARDPGNASSESEPNDDELTADAISYGARVSGTTGPGDLDLFSFTGAAGDMIRLQVFDAGNNQGSVANVDVDLLGTAGFENGAELQVYTSILQATGTYHVQVGSLVTTAYTLELSLFRSSAYEAEPNDAILDASTLDGEGRGAGVIDPALDQDLFRFTAAADEVTRVVIHAARATGSDGFFELSGHGSTLAPVVTILDELGAAIASSTALPANGIHAEGVIDGLPTAQVAFVAPASGTHYVRVEAADGGGSASHYYVIEVE